ncbi:hypothetical protein [Pontibacillus yanchengensis]|uniref:hypothetical protein n=1 Tax=Pontibacillus yanchengensis TaxID=462910 RepID=UPI000A91816D|nr:hypothetical protein [Pontibacillus yanchengensis]
MDILFIIFAVIVIAIGIGKKASSGPAFHDNQRDNHSAGTGGFFDGDGGFGDGGGGGE